MPRPLTEDAGFTLIEVVLALAVLALALAAIIQASSTSARHVAHLQDKTFAHWIAQNRLNALRLSRDWPTPGTTEGSERMANRAWRWEITVSNTPEAQLRRIDVRVRREEDPAGTSVALLTGFLREPQPDAPTEAAETGPTSGEAAPASPAETQPASQDPSEAPPTTP